jgi:flagellar hook-associated protein 1 FlgK
MGGSLPITASNITISQAWLSDAKYITASTKTPAGSGDNDNIYKMIAALDNKQTISSNFTGTFNQFANSLMNDIFVDTSYYKDIASSSSIKLNSVMDSRESVSGVSINDEAANMMKYQKAFEASSRIMTVLDEALDTIINKMGIVGR